MINIKPFLQALLIAALVASPLTALPVFAQGTVLDACPLPASALKAVSRQMFTAVSTTAVGLSSAIYNPTDGSPKPVCALIVVNSNSISAWAAGATPTAADGMIFAAPTAFSLGANNFATFLMIRAGASDAAVAVQFQAAVN